MKRALAALVTVFLTSCGPPTIKVPAGPGGPAPDAADLLAQALRACDSVRTMSAEVAVNGSAGGHKLHARLTVGVAAPASLRLEAVAPFGPPVFILVATDDDATLLLPRDDRMLQHERPDSVLQAVAGVPLGAADLRAALTGCSIGRAEAASAQRRGDDWRMVPVEGGAELYLHREGSSGRWRLVVLARHDWRADYQNFVNDLPRTIQVTGTSASQPAFDLHLALSQVDVNVPLDADVFRVRQPPGARPITLDELRQSGPLRRSAMSDRSSVPADAR